MNDIKMERLIVFKVEIFVDTMHISVKKNKIFSKVFSYFKSK